MNIYGLRTLIEHSLFWHKEADLCSTVISRIFITVQKRKGAGMNKARVYRDLFKVVEGIQHQM